MANMVKQDSVSLAWLGALEYLHTCADRKASNLAVVISKPHIGEDAIRIVIDTALEEHKAQSVHTVANTIFPQSLYLPDKLNGAARNHLYEMTSKGYGYAKRLHANRCGRYIQRLVAYPASKGAFNQLEQTVLRLQRETSRSNALSSIYELGMVAPGEDVEDALDSGESLDTGADMQIVCPDYDNQPMGFPCLSHISLTLENKHKLLHMTALYRNQHFFRKAYGNYIGLSRLLNFFCQEVGCKPGEILCVATHADAELCKRDLTALIEKCRATLSA